MSPTNEDFLEFTNSTRGPLLAVSALNVPDTKITCLHRHACGQVFGTTRGLVALGVGERHWIVSSGRSVWIPANCPHSMQSYGPIQGWSIYLDDETCQLLPKVPGLMHTTSLLNEAVLRAACWESSELTDSQRRIAQMIVDEVCSMPHDLIELPIPLDRRALRVANALNTDLSSNKSITEWAQWVGTSAKTLSRHFIDETGMTFGQWRQQARMLRALELLATNLPITVIALESGYETTSAFVAMFKRWRGVTPGQYRKMLS
jgi:AraC-like DNA-binding protein